MGTDNFINGPSAPSALISRDPLKKASFRALTYLEEEEEEEEGSGDLGRS
jgi:hypothetical protein